MTQKGTWNTLFFWLDFCSWIDIREQNTTNLWTGKKMANIGTLPFLEYIYTLHQDIFLKYEGANYSLFNIVNKSRSKMLHGNRASWELSEDMCCIFTAICRNGLFRQISESKICDFLPPLIIHTTSLEISK